MDTPFGVEASKPIPLLKKCITIDFKELSKSLSRVSADLLLGKWDDLPGDAIDALGTLGLKSTVEETAWLLIYRSMLQAMKRLIMEKADKDLTKSNFNVLKDCLDDVLNHHIVKLNKSFFEHPEKNGIVHVVVPTFVDWLKTTFSTDPEAEAIGKRFPIYFTEALHHEWGAPPKEYNALKEQLDTPFTQANDRLQAWMRYSSWIQKQVEEPLFLEAFSLKQVYVSLRGYFERKLDISKDEGNERRFFGSVHTKKVIVDLRKELDDWLMKAKKDDAVRLVSGGPGSGKSSFAKMYASELVTRGHLILFIPLHHLELGNDLIEAVGKFVNMDGFLHKNPLEAEHREERLLIIFDGLDELAMQGKIAERAAQDFVREVCRKVERFNVHKTVLQVLITGRELVVQANETDFRKEGQILHILPYFVPESDPGNFIDHNSLLTVDQRQLWWQLYGIATGSGYGGLPRELNNKNLVDITGQPLLNYLVALSLRRGKIDFTKETNMNAVYADLLKAIYERGWASQQHVAIQGIGEKDFIRILEEVALAAWHGDGRTTTIREIEKHCDNSGLRSLLGRFQNGMETDCKAKVTTLLTAFYFRHCGYKENDKTFEFTHKSFGEYLTARRIIREVMLIHKKLEDRRIDLDEGWDARDALHRWTLVCGPSIIDDYLFKFITDEVRLAYIRCPEEIHNWQLTFCNLIEFMLQHGMPIERVTPRPHFQEEDRQARNAEEALFLLLNSFARQTETISEIRWSKPHIFGNCLSRICGQRQLFSDIEKLKFLSHLDLRSSCLNARDLWHANLQSSNLSMVSLVASDCRYGDFTNAKLIGSYLAFCNLLGADFTGADLTGADLKLAFANEAVFSNAVLAGTNCRGAVLRRAKFTGADLRGADFRGADLRGATLQNAIIENTNFEHAVFLSVDDLDNVIIDAATLEVLKKSVRITGEEPEWAYEYSEDEDKDEN